MLVLPRCGQHGEGSTLLWGSCYPDAPDIYLSDAKLQAIWGAGERKWIFAEDPDREKVEKALAGRLIPVQTLADKTLVDGPAAALMQWPVFSDQWSAVSFQLSAFVWLEVRRCRAAA